MLHTFLTKVIDSNLQNDQHLFTQNVELFCIEVDVLLNGSTVFNLSIGHLNLVYDAINSFLRDLIRF